MDQASENCKSRFSSPTVFSPVFRIRNANLRTEAAEIASAGVGFSLHTNNDVMSLLAELLSDQYAFFAGVSGEWINAWGDLLKLTQAITADTTASQLQ